MLEYLHQHLSRKALNRGRCRFLEIGINAQEMVSDTLQLGMDTDKIFHVRGDGVKSSSHAFGELFQRFGVAGCGKVVSFQKRGKRLRELVVEPGCMTLDELDENLSEAPRDLSALLAEKQYQCSMPTSVVQRTGSKVNLL